MMRQAIERMGAMFLRRVLLAAMLGGALEFLKGSETVPAGSAGAVAGNEPAAAAQSYEAFKLIADRNIFDPTRGPRRASSENRAASERPAKTETFSLVGVGLDGDRAVAFFLGPDSQYKALKPADTIAGFKIVEITLNAVRLEHEGKTIELGVLKQMKRTNDAAWELSEQPVQASAGDSTAKTSGDGSSSVMDEVLKRLKQRREKEL